MQKGELATSAEANASRKSGRQMSGWVRLPGPSHINLNINPLSLKPPYPLSLPPKCSQATQHAKCRVRVTVQETSSGEGHKFKLAGVMVLPAGTNEFSSTDRLEVVVPQLFDKNG